MPRSRKRHKHHHHHSSHSHTSHTQHKPRRRSAVPIMSAFIGILGTVIAFISAGAIVVWLVVGALAGAITGYFIGRSMDKLAARNR